MNVTLLGAEGPIAEDADSIVSIRVGAARRQQALQQRRPMHFPAVASAAEAQPFKVDVLRPVGSARLAALPMDGEYAVPLAGGLSSSSTSGAAAPLLRLHVAAAPQLCGRIHASEKASSSRAMPEGRGERPPAESATSAAKEYLEEHNVLPVVQALLELLARDKPEKPKEYIAAFMQRLSEAKPPAAKLKKEEAAKAIQPVAASALAGAGRCATSKSVRAARPDLAAIFDAEGPADASDCLEHSACCRALLRLCPRLSSEQAFALVRGVAGEASCAGMSLVSFAAVADTLALGEAEMAELAGLTKADFAALSRQDEVRLEARRLAAPVVRASFRRAALLESAWRRDVVQCLRRSAYRAAASTGIETSTGGAQGCGADASAISCGAGIAEGRPLGIAASDEARLFDTRLRMQKSLELCSEDGRLKAALGMLSSGEELELAHPCGGTPSDPEECRQKLQLSLQLALEDGRLATAFSAQTPTASGGYDGVQKLKHGLLMACSDGRLEDVVAVVDHTSLEEADASKRNLQCEDAVRDGGLDRSVRSCEIERSRQHLRKELQVALSDGSLDVVLRARVDARAHVAAKTERVVDHRLGEVSSKEVSCEFTPRVNQSSDTSQEPRPTGDESSREKLRHALKLAVEDGRFESLVHARAVSNNADEVRKRFAQVLCAACEDGRLEASIEKALKLRDAGTVERVDLPGAAAFSVESSKKCLREALEQALEDGSLDHSFVSRIQHIKRNLRDALETALETRCLDHSLERFSRNTNSEQAVDLSNIKDRLQNALGLALENGNIENIIRKDMEAHGYRSLPAIHQSKEKTQCLLNLALADGRLAASLQSTCGCPSLPSRNAHGDILHSNQQKLQNALRLCVEDGRLQECLHSHMNEDRGTIGTSATSQNDEARQHLRKVLEEACRDGRLETSLELRFGPSAAVALSEAHAVEVEGHRRQLRGILETAVENGALEAALQRHCASEDVPLQLQALNGLNIATVVQATPFSDIRASNLSSVPAASSTHLEPGTGHDASEVVFPLSQSAGADRSASRGSAADTAWVLDGEIPADSGATAYDVSGQLEETPALVRLDSGGAAPAVEETTPATFAADSGATADVVASDEPIERSPVVAPTRSFGDSGATGDIIFADTGDSSDHAAAAIPAYSRDESVLLVAEGNVGGTASTSSVQGNAVVAAAVAPDEPSGEAGHQPTATAADSGATADRISRTRSNSAFVTTGDADSGATGDARVERLRGSVASADSGATAYVHAGAGADSGATADDHTAPGIVSGSLDARFSAAGSGVAAAADSGATADSPVEMPNGAPRRQTAERGPRGGGGTGSAFMFEAPASSSTQGSRPAEAAHAPAVAPHVVEDDTARAMLPPPDSVVVTQTAPGETAAHAAHDADAVDSAEALRMKAFSELLAASTDGRLERMIGDIAGQRSSLQIPPPALEDMPPAQPTLSETPEISPAAAAVAVPPPSTTASSLQRAATAPVAAASVGSALPSAPAQRLRSPRHEELLKQQDVLREERRQAAERLAQLEYERSRSQTPALSSYEQPPRPATALAAPFSPSPTVQRTVLPPVSPKPATARPRLAGGASPALRQLQEVNQGLTQENMMLRSELSHVMWRSQQSRIPR
eukprot:TRINITY_DN19111_c0_g1_i1.p1 TRINITY_DN19111_c0_g1~~TRINITY_DN19111_c0_g1_i1.p1  ORF type:complete len:1626 (-),score=317.09 TRINITY_DN19111_c0_g1_i1:167-5044(-)